MRRSSSRLTLALLLLIPFTSLGQSNQTCYPSTGEGSCTYEGCIVRSDLGNGAFIVTEIPRTECGEVCCALCNDMVEILLHGGALPGGGTCSSSTSANLCVGGEWCSTTLGSFGGAGGPIRPFVKPCEVEGCTPIVIDLDAHGFALTGLNDPVFFDIDGDGVQERLSWTSPEARMAFLVLDRNGNGLIDDGTELFGAVTDQPESAAPNGFSALAVFDRPENGGNGDGLFSREDEAFMSIRLWIDADHDGISAPSELLSLGEESIESIALSPIVSNRRDRYGNLLRWTSHVQFDRHRRLAAADVIFLVE